MTLVILIFLLLFVLVFAFVMLSSIIGFLLGKVPYVRTRQVDIQEMIKKVDIGRNDNFFDLGCGDGKVLFAVEKETGAMVRGYEITLWTHLYSRIKRVILHSSAQLIWGNFFKNDLSDATVIYCYLFPPLMPMIGEKVKGECKTGTKIISRDFPISNLNLVSSWKSPTNHTLFLYQV